MLQGESYSDDYWERATGLVKLLNDGGIERGPHYKGKVTLMTVGRKPLAW